MKEGSIVKTAIPQADGRIKFRPVLLLRKLRKFVVYLRNMVSFFEMFDPCEIFYKSKIKGYRV